MSMPQDSHMHDAAFMPAFRVWAVRLVPQMLHDAHTKPLP